MSFILDALKKSEIERQRQSIPGLVDPGLARPRPRLPGWAIALCLLLGVNLIVLLVVLLRGWTSASHATATARTHHVTAPAASNAATADGHFSPLDAPVYAPEIPVTAAGDAGTPPPVTRRPTTELKNSGSPTVQRRDSGRNDDKADDEVLPTINEISSPGGQALPKLHLDVHVFATNSAERFVYINMRKYHEGDTLREGPTVERIRRDGVVLSYHGLRFLLPRQ